MNEFFILYNDEYKAISYDKKYLYLEFRKIKNLLVKFVKEGRLSPQYKDILAAPEVKSINGKNAIVWMSDFENLKKFQDHPNDDAYVNYQDFKAEINVVLKDFENSKDENIKNWYHILSSVFDESNCFLFHNGKDICLIWGWEFDNQINYKPNFGKRNESIMYSDSEIQSSPADPINENEISGDKTDDSSNEKELLLKEFENNISDIEEETEQKSIIEEIPNDEGVYIEDEERNKKENKFLQFLKWFARKFWWLLFLLLLLIILLLILNNCERDEDLNNVEKRMEELDARFSNCNTN
jgi:hypothetical protein